MLLPCLTKNSLKITDLIIIGGRNRSKGAKMLRNSLFSSPTAGERSSRYLYSKMIAQQELFIPRCTGV